MAVSAFTKPSSWCTIRPRVRTHALLPIRALKTTIRIVGKKNSEKWIEEGCNVYQKRLQSANVDVTTEWHRSNDSLIKGVESDVSKSFSVILLDPGARELSSEDLSSSFYKWMEEGGSRVVFVIGGFDGLPPELLDSQAERISLSKLTFTHQFARLVIMEQIYRASEIRKGSSYHK